MGCGLELGIFIWKTHGLRRILLERQEVGRIGVLKLSDQEYLRLTNRLNQKWL